MTLHNIGDSMLPITLILIIITTSIWLVLLIYNILLFKHYRNRAKEDNHYAGEE